MTKATRTSNSMQISVGLFREIEVDNHIDGDNINTSRKDIRWNKTASFTAFEVMENAETHKIDPLDILS